MSSGYPVKHTVTVTTRLSSKNLGLAWAKALEADHKIISCWHITLHSRQQSAWNSLTVDPPTLKKQEDHGKLKQELLAFNDTEEYLQFIKGTGQNNFTY